jgi:hypothetical protein
MQSRWSTIIGLDWWTGLVDCIGGRISVHPRVIGIYNCFLLPTRLTAPHAVAAGHVVEINCQEITTCAWPIPVCVNTD